MSLALPCRPLICILPSGFVWRKASKCQCMSWFFIHPPHQNRHFGGFRSPPEKMGQQNISILLVSCIHLFGNYYIHLYPTWSNMVQQKTHLSRLTPPLGPFPSLVVLVLRQDSRRPKDRMGFAAPRPWEDDQEQELTVSITNTLLMGHCYITRSMENHHY